MSINDHCEWYRSHPRPARLHNPAIVRSLHFLLMNYGSKIGAAIFLRSPFITEALFCALPVDRRRSFSNFSMFGRYRNMIVLSTLEDSYDLIFISD